MIVLEIVQGLLLAYLGGTALYLFVYALIAHIPSRKKKRQKVNLNRIVVLIPGYKEDAVIVETARQALKQNYPHYLYDVVVIADSFKNETLNELNQLPIKVVEVSFEKSTKSKALNKAMKQFDSTYDIACILDADNVAEPNFLWKINESFEQGNLVIQGHRVAKNTDTPFAVLDAISEEINNHILNKGPQILGFSARLMGSGMAFEFNMFRKIMRTIDAVGGFDKELELKFTQRQFKIAYLHDAKVYDEKVSKAQAFGKQRSRWIAAQFHYFSRNFLLSIHEILLQKNFDYFHKTLQMLLAPRLIMPGILFIGALIHIILNPESPWALGWSAALTANSLAYAISIPAQFYSIKYLKALFSIPKAFWIMCKALLKIRKANTTFIHTPHTYVSTVNS